MSQIQRRSTFRLASSCFSAAASSAVAAAVSSGFGAPLPSRMRPPRAFPPPPVIVPLSLMISPCRSILLITF